MTIQCYIRRHTIQVQYDRVVKIINGVIIGSGPKQTGVDAGVFGEISLEDDYLNICVTPGIAGVAVWKKALIFNT